MRCVSIPQVEIAIRAFSQRWCGYLPRWVHFGLAVSLWRSRRDCRGRGVRGWRRGACASLRGRIGSEMLSAGSTLGLNVEAALRPPQTAPKSRMWKRHSRLFGLFSGAGRVRECALRGACRRFTPAVCLSTNRTACGMLRFYSAGSRSPFVRSRDVGAVICLGWFTSGWPFVCSDLDGVAGDAGNGGRSRRRGVGTHCVSLLALQVFPRGVRWGCAPQTAPKSLRLSGLSSRCGGVVLVQILIPAKSASAPISAPTRAKPGYTERPGRL